MIYYSSIRRCGLASEAVLCGSDVLHVLYFCLFCVFALIECMGFPRVSVVACLSSDSRSTPEAV